MPWEYENDTLESLCSTCHKKEHNIKPRKARKKPTKTADIKVKNKKRTIIVRVNEDD